MLAYNPYYLFDVGFQLSYLAVFFILFLVPRFKEWIVVRNPLLAMPWEWITVSIAAQIGTALLCFYYFGQFSTVFLFTNLPVTLLAMFLIPFAFLWLGYPVDFYGYDWIQKIVEGLVHGMVRVVDVFSALTQGAGEGLSVVIRILPALAALLTAVYMLRASGALDLAAQALAPLLDRVGVPAELLPLMLVRPISGSAALGVGAELITSSGPDSYVGRVAAVNALSREIAAGGVTLDEAEHRLAEARRIPFPKGKTQLLAGMSGTACFALIFGGTIRSALAAAAAGLIVSGYLLLCENRRLSNGFRKISAAALITLVCILGCHLLDTEASHAIIGTLMILTPGIAFTMGIRDFVQGDYLSGTIRMIDALLIAASIAIGTGLVLSLTSLLTGVTVV